MSKIYCPCNGCDKRHFCCHSTCPKYAVYREQLSRQRDIERKEYDLISFQFATKKALMKKGADRMYVSKNKKAR